MTTYSAWARFGLPAMSRALQVTCLIPIELVSGDPQTTVAVTRPEPGEGSEAWAATVVVPCRRTGLGLTVGASMGGAASTSNWAGIRVEPAPAPLFPFPSVAVQETLCVPSRTVNEPLALAVSSTVVA